MFPYPMDPCLRLNKRHKLSQIKLITTLPDFTLLLYLLYLSGLLLAASPFNLPPNCSLEPLHCFCLTITSYDAPDSHFAKARKQYCASDL